MPVPAPNQSHGGSPIPPAYRSDFPDYRRVEFSGTVFADELEEALASFYRADHRGTKDLLCDFRHAQFLDISTLVNFTASYVERASHGLRTYFGIPELKAARDFVRVWRFPESFYAATNVRFEEIIPLDDRKYLGERQTTYTGRGDVISNLEYDPDWKASPESRRNFFEFMTYRLNDGPAGSSVTPAAIPRIEGQRWNNPLILQVLRSHLASSRERDNEVSRVAIYESLSNAIRHPNATIVQAVSKFDRPEVPSDASRQMPSGNLRICVWDNGASIIDTLQPLVKAKKPIRSLRLPAYFYDNIKLTKKQLGIKPDPADHEVINTGVDPTDPEHNELIFLSALFPGVSRTISDTASQVEPYSETSEITSLEGARGMGLFALMKTVIDLFQGRLFIRSGGFKLDIELFRGYGAPQGSRYTCTVTRYPPELPRFCGNLLVIHLPIS